MGYRSDVVTIIAFVSHEDKETFVGMVEAKGDEALLEALHEMQWQRDDEYIKATYHNYKWYPSYEEVQKHDELRTYATECFGTAAWRTVQIGEDNATQDDAGGEESAQDMLADMVFVRCEIDCSLQDKFPATTQGE